MALPTPLVATLILLLIDSEVLHVDAVLALGVGAEAAVFLRALAVLALEVGVVGFLEILFAVPMASPSQLSH